MHCPVFIQLERFSMQCFIILITFHNLVLLFDHNLVLFLTMSYDTALLYVMESLGHVCLVVVMTDEDTATNDATKMSKIWEQTADIFDEVINDETTANNIPSMQQAEGVGSSHAMVGFAD